MLIICSELHSNSRRRASFEVLPHSDKEFQAYGCQPVHKPIRCNLAQPFDSRLIYLAKHASYLQANVSRS